MALRDVCFGYTFFIFWECGFGLGSFWGFGLSGYLRVGCLGILNDCVSCGFVGFPVFG